MYQVELRLSAAPSRGDSWDLRTQGWGEHRMQLPAWEGLPLDPSWLVWCQVVVTAFVNFSVPELVFAEACMRSV